MPTKTVDVLTYLWAERGDLAFDRAPPPNRIHPRFGFRSHATMPRYGKPLNGSPRWGSLAVPRTLYYGVRSVNSILFPNITCETWAYEGVHERQGILGFKDIGPTVGATVSEAHLRLRLSPVTVNSAYGLSTFSMEIYGIKEVPFRFRVLDPTAGYPVQYHDESVPQYGKKRRLRVDSYSWHKRHTDALVAWSVPTNQAAGWYNTPDISPIIRELMDFAGSGWNPAKPIAFVIRPRGEIMCPNEIDETYDWGEPDFDTYNIGWPELGLGGVQIVQGAGFTSQLLVTW